MQEKRCILVIEDDTDINEAICSFLRADGYLVISSVDGAIGLEKFYSHKVDMLILDLMLPTLDGQTILKEIRKLSSVPVIAISALNDEQTQEAVFALADDYVVKPFSLKVLLFKVGALMRRVYGETSQLLRVNQVTLDVTKNSVTQAGQQIEMTAREIEILAVLMANPKMVYSREQLITLIWGYNDYVDERVIDVHVRNIRKKLGNTFIQTVKGVGYRVEEVL
ncbi:response regulator transcription factor [Culicoidibacter larvae]|uniref:Response regulator transcription factor n=1 Tax=Culicoidibacter larvae TaxID=2579976 RepID=A0A5R8QA08_9FIRM|nr:response regulator transcription factor [Culicoidibacter larvae]TLG72756.1 response regulator transcription factor [Culicoidibacter larvae]